MKTKIEIEAEINKISEKIVSLYKSLEALKESLNIKPKIQKYKDDIDKKAVKLIKDVDSVSTSYLQRKLCIGYARAARAMDTLEEKGLVGPYITGRTTREVLKNKS